MNGGAFGEAAPEPGPKPEAEDSSSKDLELNAAVRAEDAPASEGGLKARLGPSESVEGLCFAPLPVGLGVAFEFDGDIIVPDGDETEPRGGMFGIEDEIPAAGEPDMNA